MAVPRGPLDRALMGRSQLLLLDEPSMGLAPLVVREIFSVVKKLNESGTTILLVEQNAKVALKVAKHAFVLETGEIVLDGLASDLFDNHKVKEAYLGRFYFLNKATSFLTPRMPSSIFHHLYFRLIP